jgi:hypothetical protein
MINDNPELEKELENAKYVRLVVSSPNGASAVLFWEFMRDTHGIWRTTSPYAPSALFTYELAQVIKDHEGDKNFEGVIIDENVIKNIDNAYTVLSRRDS